MSRNSRKISSTGIYHVINRGINKQTIFEDPVDYKKFLALLKELKDEYNYTIYAYCLMSNHIHLLVEEGDISLSEFMRQLNSKFATWYNKRYDRIGHLYQDRFKSEPIETPERFLVCVRYIHQNPVHASLEHYVGDEYTWSSFSSYLYGSKKKGFVNTFLYYNYFQNVREGLEYMKKTAYDDCLEYTAFKNMSDAEIMPLVEFVTGCKSTSDFQHLEKSNRDKSINSLIQIRLSNTQIARITGCSISVIEKLRRNYKFVS